MTTLDTLRAAMDCIKNMKSLVQVEHYPMDVDECDEVLEQIKLAIDRESYKQAYPDNFIGPDAFYDVQEHRFSWARPTSFGNVPVTIKVEPIPLHIAPVNLADKSVQKRLAAQWGYATEKQEPVNRYCCHACFTASGSILLDRMILCPQCGNKRCPKASNHLLPCTGSNESGQPGSVYTAPPQRQPLTDEELWKFWWDRPAVAEGEDDSMEAEFVAACRRVLAAHGIGGDK